jgi:hypothetical protein
METAKPDLKTEKNGIGKGKAGPGRPKGLRNKATRDIKELAQPYGPECIEGIAKLMKHKNPWIRLAACKEMLDRGYGRAPRAVDLRTTGNVYVSLTSYSGRLHTQPTIAQPILGPVIEQPLIEAITNGSGSNGSGNGSDHDPSAE